MNEIIVCADIHEGINFGINVDLETGVSARALDIHNNFKRVANFAIEKKAKLFVIAGDLFDRTNVAPIYREMVRKDVIEPLRKNKIKIWILAGNHDEPHISRRGTSISDFEDYDRAWVTVYRLPAVERINIGDKKILCLLLPYMHFEKLAELVKEKLGKEIPKEQLHNEVGTSIKNWLAEKAQEEADYKILIGHYFLEGAKLRDVVCPEVLSGEFSLIKDTIPKNLDIAVFGHVHLHQELGKQGSTQLVYTGATERIDWGEYQDEKGFITISPLERKWGFEKLSVREMAKFAIDIEPTEDPTTKILEKIGDVKEKLVRLEITLPAGLRAKVNETKLREKLKDSFHYDIKWVEKLEEKLVAVSFGANPFELFKNFIQLNYSNHPRKVQLLEEGTKILRDVLE
jgi:exonuclease SbcD